MTASGLVCERCGAKEGGSRRCVCGGLWVEQDEAPPSTPADVNPGVVFQLTWGGSSFPRPTSLILVTGPPDPRDARIATPPTPAAERPIALYSMVDQSLHDECRSRIATLEAELREARALVDLKTNLTADVVAANKRAGAAEAELREAGAAWNADKRATNAQVCALLDERDAATNRADEAEAEAGRLRAELEATRAVAEEAVARREDPLWARLDATAAKLLALPSAEMAGRIVDLEAQLAGRDALLAECVAMLERCLGGKTDDGYDGGIYELTLSAECERTDDEGQRFFASKVGEIIKDAHDLVRRAGGRREPCLSDSFPNAVEV